MPEKHFHSSQLFVNSRCRQGMPARKWRFFGSPRSVWKRKQLNARSFSPIPSASRTVPGIFHFRGEVLSLHDVAAFMEPAVAADDPAWVIVVEHGGERIGLGADEILDVERHASGAVQMLPVTFGDRGAICDGLLPNAAVLLSAPRMFHTDAFFSAF